MEAKNVKEIADSLYSSFLARDFFAKVVPGSVMLYAISCAIFGNGVSDFLKALNVAGWFILYGMSWSIGFAVQGIGEKLALHRAHPTDESEDQFRQRQIDFFNADLRQEVRSNKERFVVIREATANLGVSLPLLLLIQIAKAIHPKLCIVIGYISIAVLTWSLLWYHNIHRQRQRDFEIKALGNDKKEG